MKKLGDQKARTNKDRTNVAVPVVTLICTKSGEIDSQSLAFGVTTSASGRLFLRMEVVKPKNRGHLSIFYFFLSCHEANGDSLLSQTNLGPACAANAVCRAPANKNDRLGL